MIRRRCHDAIAYLRHKPDFVLGIADQAILSGTSFLLTLVLAARLDAKSFGIFSVAAAFLPLLDVFFRGFFEDGLPAAAHRVPKSRWGRLRGTLYILILSTSGAIGLTLFAIGLFVARWDLHAGLLICALGVVVPAGRVHSLYRKLCFLDSRLTRLVGSSLIYLFSMSMTIASLIIADALSAVTAMFAMAFAAGLAASPVLLLRNEFRKPSRRDGLWIMFRLSRNSGWFIGTSLLYWIGSIGLIPACGFFSSLEAGGAIRIIIVAFAPLSQISTAIVAVKVPKIAAALRSGTKLDAIQIGRQNALVLGSVAAAYSVLLLSASSLALPMLQQRGYDISSTSILMMGAALTMDAVWYALALPLIAVSQPRMYLVSRLAGLGALALILPGAVYSFGVTGAIMSMFASSASSLIVLSLRNGLSLPERVVAG